ncbi:MAG: acyl carrier protein [Nitrospira sp.]|nr:acyl carrier protein [Nitrospira sp.]
MTENNAHRIEDLVRQLILDRAWLSKESNLMDSDSLLQHKVIDSLNMIELIGFLETTFGIHVRNEELAPENFESLSAIARFVECKRASQFS